MIIWGGNTGSYPPDTASGGAYDPSSDSWEPLPEAGAPSAREQHTAVWTGSLMLVMGGYDANPYAVFNDGGRYSPTANTWTAVTISGTPAARSGHTAVWAGSEMIVWGGTNGSDYFHDTFSYTPTRALYLYQRP